MKEGCPPSPLLFVLVYEVFHARLARDFLAVDFALYVDEVAMIELDRKMLLHVNFDTP